jgi:hypothetical protein
MADHATELALLEREDARRQSENQSRELAETSRAQREAARFEARVEREIERRVSERIAARIVEHEERAERKRTSAIPEDSETEKAVLGAVLLDESTLPVVAAILRAADFYRPTHGAIIDTSICYISICSC